MHRTSSSITMLTGRVEGILRGHRTKAQSKWGRHCCRPHSHQCVVNSEEMSLASDVSPSSTPKCRCQGLSPALAPASGSTLLRSPPSDRGRSRLFLAGLRHQQAVPRSDLLAGPSNGCASSGPKTFRNAPIGRRPDFPAHEGGSLRRFQCCPRVWPKPSARGPQAVRDRPRHVIPVWNFPKTF